MHREGDDPGAAAEYALAAARYKRAGNADAAHRLFLATRALEELSGNRYGSGDAPHRKNREGANR
jgi:hypothetical protein